MVSIHKYFAQKRAPEQVDEEVYRDYYSDDLPAPDESEGYYSDDLSAPVEREGSVGDDLDQLLSQLSQQDIDDLR